VIKIDRDERRIGLSIKAANYDSDQLAAEAAAYLGQVGGRISGRSSKIEPQPRQLDELKTLLLATLDTEKAYFKIKHEAMKSIQRQNPWWTGLSRCNR
jgi:hypothetical protein